MPQFVSKRHKKILRVLRKFFGENNIRGYPGPEVNLGHLLNLSYVNLRVDALIWVTPNCAVAVEVQSDIHSHKKIFNSNLEEIQGRDELKKDMLSRLGIGLVEIWPDDLIDEDTLIKRIFEAACNNLQISFEVEEEIKEDRQWFKKKETTWTSKGFKKQTSKLPGSKFRRRGEDDKY